MKAIAKPALGHIQRAFSRSTFAVKLAVKARNQCNEIIGYWLGEDWRFEANGEAALVRQVGPAVTTFIDVGANAGEWTDAVLHAGGAAKRGLMIDASSSSIAALRSRFGSNTSVEIVHAAVSDAPGELTFFEEPEVGMTSSAIASFATTGARKTNVRAVTLDDEAVRAGFDRIDFLKVDAEGYDFRVLSGARRLLEARRVGVLQFEYNRPWAQAGSTLSAALQLLGAAGYDVFLLRSTGLVPFEYEQFGEFFSYANFVAVAPEFRSVVEPLLRR